jgi:hypothetical protein
MLFKKIKQIKSSFKLIYRVNSHLIQYKIQPKINPGSEDH